MNPVDAELNLSHLLVDIKSQVCSLFTLHWSVCANKSLFVPINDYERVIDTKSARRISFHNIDYWPHEIHVMRKCIATL